MVARSEPDPGTAGGSTRGIITVAAVGGLLFGYDTGVISGALLFIEQDFTLTPLLSGVVVSSILVGAMVGALSSGSLSDRFGRRPLLIAAALLFAIGSVAAAAAPSAALLVAARVVLGLAVGMASTLVPVYISEMAAAGRRGRLVAVNQLMITIGIVLAYAANYAFADVGGWRAMFLVALLPAAVLGVGMVFLPETPRFLIRTGRTEEARAVLARLRGGAGVEAEIAEIAGARGETGGAGLRGLLRPWVRPALVAGIGLQILGQASGVNTVIYYAPTIFRETGLEASGAILATVGIGAVNVVGTLVGMNVVDRWGRTRLLTAGAAVMAVSLAVLAVALGIGGPAAPALAFGAVVLYVVAVATSLNVVVFIIPTELYPLSVRGSAMSVTLFANWGMNFLVALTFLSLLEALGGAATFWAYAAVCAALALFAARVIPETKGRTLEQIEADLRAAGTPTHRP
ncbi:sugar porter (SP) family MFS transporter [Murinocardiopsis flavida]|uniref:Sugar porter (SP) family MFS transporter n=1 Tax=Murinocardiopsis flavida TaxID=645275 RepID=A0A2P8CXH8_9ACTN|nr:sugar porter family MFS transporter [Murinocardiopsis flavida]PSK89685.1 sugar porter (SP) family MFS transporter [Murinocardiopsis flavida]